MSGDRLNDTDALGQTEPADSSSSGSGGRNIEEERVLASVARSMLGQIEPPPKIGRFEVRGRLGVGGMGEVYTGWDPELERELAIKVLGADRESDPTATGRMKREARALAQLAHPNVVQVYEVGSVDGQLFIAMELLRGETLRVRLERKGRLSSGKTVSIVRDICRAIGKAHELDIVHRDLKPGNVFLERTEQSERCKVLDFGVAKSPSSGHLASQTASGVVLGTPYYMSPEQARDSSNVDHRADLWAVAIIAYECLVGKRPFDGSNISDLAMQILGDATPTPSEHGKVPAGFDAWFARATDRNPSRRYGSAAKLADALADALGHRDAARSPAPSMGLRVGAAAVVLGGVGFAFWLAASSEQNPLADRPVQAEPVEPAARPQRDPLQGKTIPESGEGTAGAAPETIELHIEGAPPGATVYAGDERLGELPGAVDLPRGDVPLRLRIEADGHSALEIEVTPTRDQTRALELAPAVRKRPRAKPGRSPGRKKAGTNVDDLEF